MGKSLKGARLGSHEDHDLHDARSGHTATGEFVDPVCSMKTEGEKALVRYEHEEQPYYFYSGTCRDEFKGDPASLLRLLLTTLNCCARHGLASGLRGRQVPVAREYGHQRLKTRRLKGAVARMLNGWPANGGSER
ncbi:MAG: YHS domain-containing protein [Deltaproteobacteria bacterium]|nr:YHS domain-containing protein [Deltaproteobacteria bacterium]